MVDAFINASFPDFSGFSVYAAVPDSTFTVYCPAVYFPEMARTHHETLNVYSAFKVPFEFRIQTKNLLRIAISEFPASVRLLF